VSPAPVSRPVLGLLAALTLLFHLATAPGYGYFRDELYYLACAEHLSLGYVDHPPLVAWIAALVRAVLGTSLHALRLVPALAAAATVYTTGAIAARLGGRRYAQALAALAVMLAPVYLATASVFSMNALDQLAWALCFYLALRALDAPRYWLAFGLVAGIGLLNKLSVLFLGFGLLVGLLLARRWDVFKNMSFWLGGAVALLLFAPHLAWQVAHGLPTREFMANAAADKNLALAPLAFLREQALQLGPGALPIWLAGLAALLLAPAARPVRALGWCWLAVLAVMLSTSAKPYYLAPAYTALLAAGAVALESRLRRPAVRALLLLLVLGPGLLAAPLAKPLLREDAYVRYAAALGVAPGSDERHALGRLPQFFADMHGWPEFAAAIADVYHRLPERERAVACVVGGNYGEAGAIDLFGRPLGLPPAISTHNSYFLWGPRGCTGEVVIVPTRDPQRLARLFARVERAATFDCVDCMPYEDDLPIWLARDARAPLADVWPELKSYR
jgi:hypothetical protein